MSFKDLQDQNNIIFLFIYLIIYYFLCIFFYYYLAASISYIYDIFLTCKYHIILYFYIFYFSSQKRIFWDRIERGALQSSCMWGHWDNFSEVLISFLLVLSYPSNAFIGIFPKINLAHGLILSLECKKLIFTVILKFYNDLLLYFSWLILNDFFLILVFM
jgi:hypothetical protein